MNFLFLLITSSTSTIRRQAPRHEVIRRERGGKIQQKTRKLIISSLQIKRIQNGAPHAGKILKLPKSWKVQLFTDAKAYDVTFPRECTSDQKVLLASSAVFINSNFQGAGETVKEVLNDIICTVACVGFCALSKK